MMKGLIFGQFCPLHNAHLALIRATRALCDELHFGLFETDESAVPLSLRVKWLEAFGEVTIMHVQNADDPYAEIQTHAFPDIDLVAGSNPLVPEIAKRLGAAHFMWDPDREAFPIDSDAIITNPAAHWQEMPENVRIHTQKRLTFVGPESVGKSFFAKRMAEKFGGPHVPEYGRPHEKHRPAGDYTGSELAELARRHRASREAISAFAGPILFEDTDELMTAVWAEMLLGEAAPEVEAQIELPDLYILFSADTPWEDDSLRYFAKQEIRQSFFRRIEAKLKAHDAKYLYVDGDWQGREAVITNLVESWLHEAADFH